MGCLEALAVPRDTTPSGLPIVLVSAACLVDKEGRILLTQRPEGKSMAGLWEFPGGKVDEGESPEFALCRELEEELGLDVRECCLYPIAFASHAYNDFHLLMPVFVCRMWNGEPQSKEGQALKWVKPKEMYDLPMPEADIPLVSQILDRL
ncbi:MAG: 8-oxo-dGTP diphosphatase MutT [Micavibrio sp.]|nr:8-oxo-dGTP diphosphatase MutT [Micavibrio sp.]|tara:strand:- start:399 stop:848 length:450 start_codon:yes stop_codon:yes gene_type:complete